MPTAFFNDLLQTLTERGRTLLGLPGDVALSNPEVLVGQIMSEKGEASGTALARALLDGYEMLPSEKRLAFLGLLAERFGADHGKIAQAIEAYAAAPGEATAQALHAAAEPSRQELIRRLNLAPGGTAALVRMRADLLAHMKDNAALRAVDADFTHLLSSWFNPGFLVLRQIDWTTPANILEKIIRYEAVHAIHDWEDLRRRLEPIDRRCFAFFHPRLPDEPLIFVEVALTRDVPEAIAPLLAEQRDPIAAEKAATAVFYSISNTQKGLAGVSFGHFLIKQVAEELKRALPNLKTFVTLSPAPGFAGWLAGARADPASEVLDDAMRQTLDLLDQPGWHEDAQARERLAAVLTPLAAHYYLAARNSRGVPPDPVARFHLGNGARLERLNLYGDLSPKGLSQAHGLMVNYLYALDEIEANHEAYARHGAIAAAPAVRKAVPSRKQPA